MSIRMNKMDRVPKNGTNVILFRRGIDKVVFCQICRYDIDRAVWIDRYYKCQIDDENLVGWIPVPI
jgi:hypothetical protein